MIKYLSNRYSWSKHETHSHVDDLTALRTTETPVIKWFSKRRRWSGFDWPENIMFIQNVEWWWVRGAFEESNILHQWLNAISNILQHTHQLSLQAINIINSLDAYTIWYVLVWKCAGWKKLFISNPCPTLVYLL